MHRLLAVCTWLSLKFWEDDHVRSHNFAKVAGLSEGELFDLEAATIHMLRWQLYISADLFQTYRTLLEALHLPSINPDLASNKHAVAAAPYDSSIRRAINWRRGTYPPEHRGNWRG